MEAQITNRDVITGRFIPQQNVYDLSGEYGIGYTLKGEPFWFDLEDYDLIKDYCWHYTQKGYLEATNAETRKAIKLHRLVMGVTDPKVEVDHKKHPTIYEHKIDNRKSNLEIVNQSQNSMNRSLAKNNTSGIVGVSWSKLEQKWKAYIKINQQMIHLGTFTDKEDAIVARKNAELKYFGEYRYDANN